jgi:hypothetical protein
VGRKSLEKEIHILLLVHQMFKTNAKDISNILYIKGERYMVSAVLLLISE